MKFSADNLAKASLGILLIGSLFFIRVPGDNSTALIGQTILETKPIITLTGTVTSKMTYGRLYISDVQPSDNYFELVADPDDADDSVERISPTTRNIKVGDRVIISGYLRYIEPWEERGTPWIMIEKIDILQ